MILDADLSVTPESLPLFYDAIVHNRYLPGAIAMRMSICVAGNSVCGPSGVAYADISLDGIRG